MTAAHTPETQVLEPREATERRVCTVVVTFNRKELLARCLRALREQVGPQDRILVVNNASSDGTAEMLESDFSDVCVLNMEENTGGAGGFHAGTKKSFDDGYEYAWLMDDDGMPAPGCMDALLLHAAPNRVTIPIQQEDSGLNYGFIAWRRGRTSYGQELADEIVARGVPVTGRFIFTFVGPMVGRGVFETIGLPNKEFFIWSDDFDFALRIQQHKSLQAVAVPGARFRHNLIQSKVRDITVLGRTSTRPTQGPFRIYYSVRNYFHILCKYESSRRPALFYFASQIRSLAGDLVYEPERWKCASTRLRALRDGARGKLGKREF